MRSSLLIASAALIASLLAGCNSDSGTLAAAPIAAPNLPSTAAFNTKSSISPAASAGATQIVVPLPPSGAYSGQATLPVSSVPSGLKMTVTYSNAPPAGLTTFAIARQPQAAGQRTPLDTQSTNVVYACIGANQLVVLNGAPLYSFVLPPAFDTAGVAYYAAIDENAQWVSGYGGPGKMLTGPSSTTVSMLGRFGFAIPANGEICVALYGRSTRAPSPTPALSGSLAIDSSTLTFATNAPQTLTATETGYSGTFSATSANTAIATVAPGATSGTFVVTPIAMGTTTVTILAGTQTAHITVTVTGLSPGVALSASTLTFTSSTPQSIAATLTGYSGTFSATSANTAIATVAAGGVSGTFVVTPIAIGTTTITVVAGTKTAVVTITVTALSPPGSIILNVSTLTFASSTPQSLTATLSGYSGTFSATSANTTVATVAPSGVAGAFTVTPIAIGTTTITVVAGAKTAVVTIVVTALSPPGDIVLNASALTFASSTPQSLTATLAGFSGTFSATSADTAVATVAPGIAVGVFIVTPVAVGTTTISVVAGTKTAQVAITVTALSPGVVLDASALTFASSTPQSLTATLSGYGGTFSASSADTAVATVAPGLAAGQFTVTPVAVGTTTITVVAGTKTASITVTVTALTPIAITSVPIALTDGGLAIGPGSVETLAVSQAGVTGAFTATSTCDIGPIATLTGSPGTSFTVTGVNAGSCTVTFTNGGGQTMTIPVVVSGVIIPVQ